MRDRCCFEPDLGICVDRRDQSVKLVCEACGATFFMVSLEMLLMRPPDRGTLQMAGAELLRSLLRAEGIM